MRRVILTLVGALAIGCGGTAESPTAPTSNPDTRHIGPPQTYDSHPVPDGDPEPGADPAPPPPPAEPAPPAAPTFEGTYSGSGTGTQINLGPAPPPTSPSNFVLTVVVAGEVVTGALGTPPGAEFQATIPLAGTASASGAVTFTAKDFCGGQLYTFVGSITDGSAGDATMTGTWSQPPVADCSRGASGTWTATRTTATPAPAPTPTSLTGRWIGVAPDGNIISDPQSCDSEQDLTFDLTQTGTTLSGTVSDRPRKHNPSVCSAPTTGKVVSLTGTVGADVFSFTVPGERARTVNCSGTFTSTRLTGTCDGGNGTFAVNRQ